MSVQRYSLSLAPPTHAVSGIKLGVLDARGRRRPIDPDSELYI
jgi:hypothetical protein